MKARIEVYVGVLDEKTVAFLPGKEEESMIYAPPGNAEETLGRQLAGIAIDRQVAMLFLNAPVAYWNPTDGYLSQVLSMSPGALQKLLKAFHETMIDRGLAKKP